MVIFLKTKIPLRDRWPANGTICVVLTKLVADLLLMLRKAVMDSYGY